MQLLELGRWQSVCTNSRNWTQADLEVACRQLGFQGGEWVFWYPHLNDTNQILYQDPGKIIISVFIFRQSVGIFDLEKLDKNIFSKIRVKNVFSKSRDIRQHVNFSVDILLYLLALIFN